MPLIRSISSDWVKRNCSFGGNCNRVTQGRAAARNDADLVDRIGVLAVGGDQGVADFVIGHTPLLFLGQTAALAFRTGHDFLDGVFQVALDDLRCHAAGGQQRGFVHRVGQVRARKARRGLRNLPQIDISPSGMLRECT